jgi:malate dehydrogenase (oxaloacetate-decarboxylating)(NADP+)
MSYNQTSNVTTDDEALQLHLEGRPGKLEIRATKPLTTQRDLSLAYSPGVAVPCLRIHEIPTSPTTTPPRATWWR